MDHTDRIIIILALSAVVAVLLWESAPSQGVNDDERLNVSTRPSSEAGPAYLVSNLPLYRNSDSVMPIVGEFDECS